MAKRYCGMCDEWVKGRECPKCGADTDKALKPAKGKSDDLREAVLHTVLYKALVGKGAQS
jgi:hypothetical protein